MAEFKTRYIREAQQPPQSTGEFIQSAFQSVGDAFQVVAQEKKRKLDENASRYGVNEPVKAFVPTGLNTSQKAGAQLLLDDYQKKAAKAKLNPTQSNVEEFSKAKQEYEDFLNVAKAVSNVNNDTVRKIQSGEIKDMLGSPDEILLDYSRYEQSNEVSYNEGQLLVNGKYWRESPLADVKNVYIPPVAASETKYAPELQVTSVIKDKFNRNYTNYYETTAVEGKTYYTGKIKETQFNSDWLDRMKLDEGEPEFNRAIAYHQYSSVDVRDNESFGFTDQDKGRALKQYNPEMDKYNIVVNDIATPVGKILSVDNGVVTFAVPDEAIKALPSDEEQQAIFAWRKAKRKYYEDTYRMSREAIAPPDQSAQAAADKSYSNRVPKTPSESKESDQSKLLKEAPAMSISGGAPVFQANYDVTFNNNEAKATRVEFNGNGEIASITISIPKAWGAPEVKSITPNDSNWDDVITQVSNKGGNRIEAAKLKASLWGQGQLQDSDMKSIGAGKSVSSQSGKEAISW
jgi:hypothetical protein